MLRSNAPVLLSGQYLPANQYESTFIAHAYHHFDPSHKSHNALDNYPHNPGSTTHHFVTEMCIYLYVSITKWYIRLDMGVVHCGICTTGLLIYISFQANTNILKCSKHSHGSCESRPIRIASYCVTKQHIKSIPIGSYLIVVHSYQFIGPPSHWSPISLVPHLIGPPSHWSPISLIPQLAPMHHSSHWSPISLVPRLIGPPSHWSPSHWSPNS